MHVNCSLWSAEVYEEVDGTLQNVFPAISRARNLRCLVCGVSGAAVGCNAKSCNANFHFMCARKVGCVFQLDKKIYCRNHVYEVDGKVLVLLVFFSPTPLLAVEGLLFLVSFTAATITATFCFSDSSCMLCAITVKLIT